MGAAASTNASSEDFQATAKKGVTVLTEFFELQASMATGKVDDAKMAEFATKLAGYIAPEVSWDVGGNGSGPHSGKGDFGAMIASVGSYWMGIENKAVKNTNVCVDVEHAGKIAWSQIYDAVVNGTPMAIPVTHAITLDENQKIVSWVQLLDTKAFEEAKAGSGNGNGGGGGGGGGGLISRVTKVPIKPGSTDAIVAAMSTDAFAKTTKAFVGFDGAEAYALGDDALITHSRWVSQEASEGGVAALGQVLKEHLTGQIAGPPEPLAVGPLAWEFGALSDDIAAYRIMKLNLQADKYDAALALAQNKTPDFEAVDGLKSIRMIRASDTEALIVAGYPAMEKLEAATPAIMAIMMEMMPFFSGPPDSVGAVTRIFATK